MENSIELKKYHIMEYLMDTSDLKLLDKVERIITENSSHYSKQEMISRAVIAEQQLENGEFKTCKQAKERLSKWMK